MGTLRCFSQLLAKAEQRLREAGAASSSSSSNDDSSSRSTRASGAGGGSTRSGSGQLAMSVNVGEAVSASSAGCGTSGDRASGALSVQVVLTEGFDDLWIRGDEITANAAEALAALTLLWRTALDRSAPADSAAGGFSREGEGASGGSGGLAGLSRMYVSELAESRILDYTARLLLLHCEADPGGGLGVSGAPLRQKAFIKVGNVAAMLLSSCIDSHEVKRASGGAPGATELLPALGPSVQFLLLAHAVRLLAAAEASGVGTPAAGASSSGGGSGGGSSGPSDGLYGLPPRLAAGIPLLAMRNGVDEGTSLEDVVDLRPLLLSGRPVTARSLASQGLSPLLLHAPLIRVLQLFETVVAVQGAIQECARRGGEADLSFPTPVSRRFAFELCMRIVDLAVWSAAAGGGADSGQASASPQPALAPAGTLPPRPPGLGMGRPEDAPALLRLRPSVGWSLAFRALTVGRSLLEYPRGDPAALWVTWWRGMARALQLPVTVEAIKRSPDGLMQTGRFAYALSLREADLPERPPAQPALLLGAALSAGIVPAMDRCLRRAGTKEAGNLFTACTLLLPALLQDAPGGQQSRRPWRLLQQLMAFGTAAEVASLAGTISKLMHRCVDEVEAEAGAAQAGGAGKPGRTLGDVMLWTAVGLLESALPDPPGLQRSVFVAADEEEKEKLAPRAARKQLQKVACYALNRWLPALARAARVEPKGAADEAGALGAAQLVMRWAVVLMAAMMSDATAARMMGPLGGHAAATARQRLVLLVRDVDVVAVMGTVLRRLPRLRLRLQHEGPACEHGTLVLLLDCMRMSMDVIREPLRAALRRQPSGGGGAGAGGADAAAESPWSSASLAALTRLRCVARDPELRAYATGVVAGLESMREGGEGGGEDTSGLSTLPTALRQIHVLMFPSEVASGLPRACSNPRCANLSGDSEAALDASGLSKCGGCGAAWYCGQDCQRAHWRAGHREDCAAGRRKGGRA